MVFSVLRKARFSWHFSQLVCWTSLSDGSCACVCAHSTSAGDLHILAVVCESSCLWSCWSRPYCCQHGEPWLVPGMGLNSTNALSRAAPAGSQQEDARASKAPCLGGALCTPSLWIQYLCCRGLHRSNSFPCSILWHALSNGEPTYSQPQESSTKQQTLWIWWLRISCLCSGCLQVQKIFHC